MDIKQHYLKPEMLNNILIDKVRNLKIMNPTFIAGNRKLIRLCKDLSQRFHTNYAFIKHERGRFGPNLVLYGKINPTVILFEDPDRPETEVLDDFDLVKCAGARKIYLNKLEN